MADEGSTMNRVPGSDIPTEARVRRIVAEELERLLPGLLEEIARKQQADRDRAARGQGFQSFEDMQRKRGG